MTMTPKELEAHYATQDREHDLQKMTLTHRCAVCGHGLRAGWNGTEIALACGGDKSHVGTAKIDPTLDRLWAWRRAAQTEDDIAHVDGLIMEYQQSKSTRRRVNTMGTELAKYENAVVLTKDSAVEIIRTLWPDASEVDRKKAVLTCINYRLNPLMGHLFLVKFGNSWVQVLGINATRLMASRQCAFGEVDGPRLMTDKEQKSIYGEIDTNEFRAIYAVQTSKGLIFKGYGTWKKSNTVHGADKGNSGPHMAFIRAERAALKKMAPSEMPADIHDVVDEAFMPKYTEVQADQLTGEIEETATESLSSPEEAVEAEVLDNDEAEVAGLPKGQMMNYIAAYWQQQGIDKSDHEQKVWVKAHVANYTSLSKCSLEDITILYNHVKKAEGQGA